MNQADQPSFDPSTLPRFCVLRMPLMLNGEERFKFMVVLGHGKDCAGVILTTSIVKPHKEDPKLMKGVVFYGAGELAVFSVDTAIEPDNRKTIGYDQMFTAFKNHRLTNFGACLHPNFATRLKTAIDNNYRLCSPAKLVVIKLAGL